MLPGTFTNPIVRSRDAADPWLVAKDGWYYFTFTAGKHIEVWKSRTITGLDDAKKVVVWRAPDKGPNAEHVWAPELHFVRGKWYIYYTATDGPDPNRRQFVLEANTSDPQGPYTEKGQLVVPVEDRYAIDGSVFQTEKGALYYVWSGRERSEGGTQNIYIAPMSNPWTISGQRVSLSKPTFDWELHGWPVNEGPEVLVKNGKTFIIYSASGGTTPEYCLGMLTNEDGNLLRAESWVKSPLPVFHQYKGPDGEVFTPGHNGFCKSPDGKEDWIIYHGKANTDGTWGGRTARAQQFIWTPDGRPFFGHPIPPGIPLAVPSGEPGAVRLKKGRGTGLRGTYFADKNFQKQVMDRVDPIVAFDWGMDAPARGLPTDGFAVRWRGQIEPRFTENYTFLAYADDGVRVWIDGKPIISDWADHAPTATQGSIALAAGKKYGVVVEYYDNVRGARVSLHWSSPSQPFEIVPTDCLFPAPAEKSRE